MPETTLAPLAADDPMYDMMLSMCKGIAEMYPAILANMPTMLRRLADRIELEYAVTNAEGAQDA